jgi:hypothetical protein
MNIKTVGTFSLIATGASIIFFAYINQWIIIQYPLTTQTDQAPLMACRSQKKKVALMYWHNAQWHTENSELIWTDNATTNLIYLVDTWLSLADEEKVMDRKISLQTAIINPVQKQAYLSFNRSPFNGQQTIMHKWMVIEGLLKTIAQSGIDVRTIYVLENHQPLVDPHLDFSNAWPIEGFLK